MVECAYVDQIPRKKTVRITPKGADLLRSALLVLKPLSNGILSAGEGEKKPDLNGNQNSKSERNREISWRELGIELSEDYESLIGDAMGDRESSKALAGSLVQRTLKTVKRWFSQ